LQPDGQLFCFRCDTVILPLQKYEVTVTEGSKASKLCSTMHVIEVYTGWRWRNFFIPACI